MNQQLRSSRQRYRAFVAAYQARKLDEDPAAPKEGAPKQRRRYLREYFRWLSPYLSFVSISGSQRAEAPRLPWVGTVYNGIPVSEYPFQERKEDFLLRIPGREPVALDNLRREEAQERYRLFFRLPPPQQTTNAEVVWRHHRLGEMTLPVVGRMDFLQRLVLQQPTLAVRLGDQTVACQTFVTTQCRGLVASALLVSPTAGSSSSSSAGSPPEARASSISL